ncbi:hypothetical protein [Cryptosporangium japonicum]|uniref:Shikimate kinase n=1 Tax=Cryptosporangium japonicum TaxID=80872 RepID=A0ABP3EXP4_9ACTN
MTLVWVTGNSGAGKSSVAGLLKRRGHDAIDADMEGYHHWVDRVSGARVSDPPDPVPPGWLNRFGWIIDRDRVVALAARATDRTVYLCGSVENEDEVLDLFDVVVCLVVDTPTLRSRLANRTTNSFGAHPEELAAALRDNVTAESTYRRLGATIIDATQPLAVVTDQVLAAGSRGRGGLGVGDPGQRGPEQGQEHR